MLVRRKEDRMKQGTWSVLLGCHSPMHSLVVIVAWKKWYGSFPNWWQFICILIHDIGHWGTDYLDDYEAKKQHAVLGSQVAMFLFGPKGYELVAGHNTYKAGEQSQLYFPDKYASVIAPVWWQTLNNFFEPKLRRPGYTRRESAIMFKEAMRKNMENGFQERGHDIYLRQWGNPDTGNPIVNNKKGETID